MNIKLESKQELMHSFKVIVFLCGIDGHKCMPISYAKICEDGSLPKHAVVCVCVFEGKGGGGGVQGLSFTTNILR